MEQCMFCGQIAEMIYVHGHYQCSRCHQVVVPCCNGETAEHMPAVSSVGYSRENDEKTNGSADTSA